MNSYQYIRSCLLVLFLSLVLFQNCSGQVSAGDTFLFGLSEQFDKLFSKEEASTSCTSDVTVTTKAVYLDEDGDVTATYNAASDNGLTEVDGVADGAAWGYKSFETCIYPNLSFSPGNIEFTVDSKNTYDTRLTMERSFPIPVNGNPIPNKLSFSSNGDAARQCFKFQAPTNDLVRNTTVASATIQFGKIVQKNSNGDTYSGNYTNKIPCGITISLEDDETPGVRVSNISRVMEEPGPNATATNGEFKVKLRGQVGPTADVTIPINDTFDAVNVGNREGTANPKTLTFTSGNWSTEQTITVSSYDDLELDGLKNYSIDVARTSSSDSVFNGIEPRNVVVYNKDQSVPGFSILRFSGGAAVTSESSTINTITGFATDENNQFGDKYSNFQIKLRTKPTNNVTLNFTSNCGAKCNIQTPSLIFSPTDWNTYQTFRVIGTTDSANTGNVDYTVSFTVTSADTTYSTTVYKPNLSIRSCDNDGTHLIQPCNYSGAPRGTTDSRLSAQEGGSTNIWLITKTSPSSPVTVAHTSTDTTEGTVPANVTIDSNNFNTMDATGTTNKITLTHVDDSDVDLTQNWTVTTATSTGGLAYDPIDIFAATTDDEKAFYVTHVGSPKEGTANVATVHVCLGGNNPTQSVVLNISCKTTYTANDGAYGECGTISPNQIIFPPNSAVETINASDAGCANSAKKQSFTVSGQDDTYADGNQSFDIQFAMAANTDTNYSVATNPGNHSITNEDDEPLGKAIFVTTGSYNGEMTAQGVFAADDTCNNNKPSGVPAGTYKALIVSNSAGGVTNDRIPNGTNWVLSAGRHYYRCNSSGYSNCSDQHTRLFIADGSAGFDPTSLGRSFSTIGDQYWTGMTNALSPAIQASSPTCPGDGLAYIHNCNGFTYQNCPSTPTTFLYGQTWTMASATSISSQESLCSATKKLICIEQ